MTKGRMEGKRTADSYTQGWDNLWIAMGHELTWVIELRGTEYWVSPPQCSAPELDIGPFDSFDVAATCWRTVPVWE